MTVQCPYQPERLGFEFLPATFVVGSEGLGPIVLRRRNNKGLGRVPVTWRLKPAERDTMDDFIDSIVGKVFYVVLRGPTWEALEHLVRFVPDSIEKTTRGYTHTISGQLQVIKQEVYVPPVTGFVFVEGSSPELPVYVQDGPLVQIEGA